MFAAGTIPTTTGPDGRLYINLVDLCRHLMMTAKSMEAEVKVVAGSDPLLIAQGMGMIDTLYVLIKTLAEVGVFEMSKDALAGVEGIDDLFNI